MITPLQISRYVCLLHVVLAVLLPLRSLYAEKKQAEIHEIFSEAKSFFNKANSLHEDNAEKSRTYYGKAAVYFESLYLNYHIKNGKLFYNIANAWFKAGNTGKAILYYKRALRFIPQDENLKKNLAYVRSKKYDVFAEKEEGKIIRTVFFWHYALPFHVKLVLFIGFFVLFWTAAGFLLMRKIVLLAWLRNSAFFFCLVFAASLAFNVIVGLNEKSGVITVDSVIARKGDSHSYQPSFDDALHEGTEFTLLEKRRDWLNIELSDGKNCWIPASSAALVAE